jgi:hypothetical protein
MRWRELATEPTAQLTTVFIRDKFEADGAVHDVHKQRPGRPCTATLAMELKQFTRSPQKSAKQRVREIGIR